MDGWKLEDDPFLLRWSVFFSGANFCSIQEAVAGCFFLPVPFGFSYLGVGPYLRSATDGGRLLPSSLQCRQVGRTSRQWPEVGDGFFSSQKKGISKQKTRTGPGWWFQIFRSHFGSRRHYCKLS